MRRCLVVILAVFISNVILAQQEMAYVDHHFVDRNGIPVTGEFKISYEPTEVSADVRLSYGIMNGPAVYFYPDGQLKEVAHYTDGLKDGQVIRYAENGMVLMEAHYRHGQKDGVWKIWDKDGNLCMRIVYTNGEKSGVWKQWDEKGRLIRKKHF